MAVSKKEHVPPKFIEPAKASISISECNRSGILYSKWFLLSYLFYTQQLSRISFQIS